MAGRIVPAMSRTDMYGTSDYSHVPRTLLGVPFDLRLDIFDHVFRSDMVDMKNPENPHTANPAGASRSFRRSRTQASVLRICKQLNGELAAMVYGRQIFNLTFVACPLTNTSFDGGDTAGVHNQRALRAWARSIGPENCRFVKHVRIPWVTPAIQAIERSTSLSPGGKHKVIAVEKVRLRMCSVMDVVHRLPRYFPNLEHILLEAIEEPDDAAVINKHGEKLSYFWQELVIWFKRLKGDSPLELDEITYDLTSRDDVEVMTTNNYLKARLNELIYGLD